MTKLLRAGVRRYLHSFVFWLALVATVTAAFVAAIDAKNFYFSDFYIIIVLVALAVMITWLVGRECDEGIIRNKIVCGHTKGQIFISELILSTGAVSVLFLLFALIFSVINSYVFTKAEGSVILKIFFDVWLANICFSVILVTVASLIPKRAISAVINIILIFAIAFGAYTIQSFISEEEYMLAYEYEHITIESEQGTHIVSVPIEGSEHLIENPRYVGGPVRVITIEF